MAAWGTAIFSDDLACDLRDEFRDLIGEGLSPEAATAKLRAEYDLEEEPDERPVFYLALAATQWKLGRLLDDIRDEALRVIDSGEEIERWKALLIDDEDTGSVKRRQAALTKLRGQLLKPQPKPKKIRLPYASRTDWEIGYAVAYRLLSGRFVVLRVIGIDEGRRYRYPMVDLADWIGKQPPTRSEVDGLPRMHSALFETKPRTDGTQPRRLKLAHEQAGEGGRDAVLKLYQEQPWVFCDAASSHLEDDGRFHLYEKRAGELPIERLTVIATDLKLPPATEAGMSVFGGWSELDRYLADNFEIH